MHIQKFWQMEVQEICSEKVSQFSAKFDCFTIGYTSSITRMASVKGCLPYRIVGKNCNLIDLTRK